MPTLEMARFDDADFYLDEPNATFKLLRATNPVHWYEGGQFWVITKYDDIRFISSHPNLFASERIAILSDLIAHRLGQDPEGYGNRGVMFMDPPEHVAYRKAISAHLTPKVVSGIEPRVRKVVRDILDGLPDGEFDWIEYVAETIPVYVFSALLGVPEEDWPKVSGWATTIANAGTGNATEADMNVIYNEIGPYLFGLTELRRKEPADDLLTALTLLTVNGKPLDETEVITYGTTLLAAGSETTQSLIAGLAHCLDAYPQQSLAVFARDDSGAGVVEETLRWWSPVMSMARQAKHDFELRGRTIHAGDGVLMAYSSANRDEEHWGPTSDDFVITRPDASQHVGFGYGEHFCMGAALARREVRILVEELRNYAKGIEVVAEPVLRRSPLMHTYDRLPVRLIR